MKLDMSPYETRQEMYRDDPWKMVMICFMLNQTSHKQVDQVREQFFERFPDAKSIVDAEESDIANLIKPLGFYNKRAKSWKKFCQQWIDTLDKYKDGYLPISELEKMHGVGKYALDSWKVFQLYQYDTQVEDHVLTWYVEWARKEVESIKRANSPWKPMTVYFLHFQDDRFFVNNWNKARDYACCVMARTQNEAIEKVTNIAMKDPHAKHIKIMGIGHGKEEWVDEEKPLRSDPAYYERISARALLAAKENKISTLQKVKYKYD